MLIRATRQVCFVMLPNGLTLELVYAPKLTGETRRIAVGASEASHAVWLMGERVLLQLRAGQA